MIIFFVTVFFLGLASYFDVFKDKLIDDKLFYAWFGSVVILKFFFPQDIALSLLFLVISAVVFFTLRKFSGIGEADLILIGIMGFTYPSVKFIVLWLVASYVLFTIFFGVYSWKKKDFNLSKEYPMIPFFLIGFVLTWMMI